MRAHHLIAMLLVAFMLSCVPLYGDCDQTPTSGFSVRCCGYNQPIEGYGMCYDCEMNDVPYTTANWTPVDPDKCSGTGARPAASVAFIDTTLTVRSDQTPPTHDSSASLGDPFQAAAAQFEGLGGKALVPLLNVDTGISSDWVGSAKCDSGGNIYYIARQWNGGNSSYAVVSIGKNGGSHFMQSRLYLTTFAVSPEMVYAVGIDKKGARLAERFNGKGELLEMVPLQVPPIAVISQAVALPSGNLLVAGELAAKPYLAMLGPTRMLVKEISLKGEADFAHAALGMDGNAYLLRSSGSVLVINTNGEVIGSLELPVPQAGMTAKVLSISRKRLAVSFTSGNSTLGIVATFDLDGSPIDTFKAVARDTQAWNLTCYDGQDFAFLDKGKSNTMHIITAH